MANRKQTPLAIRTKQELLDIQSRLKLANLDLDNVIKRNRELNTTLEDRNKLIAELKSNLNSLAEQNSAIWKEYREFKQLVSLAMDNIINKERSRNLSNSANLQAMNKD